jgi:molecular chaperone Hsp33
MSDALLRVFFPQHDLKASVVLASDTAREAQRLHGLRPTSAALLAQALAGGALIASLQKDATRVTLQLECDGPMRGLLVDASSSGTLRGYVKQPGIEVESAGAFRWRPALGNKGFLSVLRDRGESDFYRSSIELEAFELAEDLERYFRISDQVATRVALSVATGADRALTAVAGALVQALPAGNPKVLGELGERLQVSLDRALATPVLSAAELAARLFEGLPYEVTGTAPVSFLCTCSREAVLSMLAALGKAELESMIAEQAKAEVTCQFCGKKHTATAAELAALAASPPD